VIIMVSPFGNYSMLASYIVIAKTNSKYGYISRGKAFFRGDIGYIIYIELKREKLVKVAFNGSLHS
jgi:hypothetical protein